MLSGYSSKIDHSISGDWRYSGKYRTGAKKEDIRYGGHSYYYYGKEAKDKLIY
jgi:hypothetical protein